MGKREYIHLGIMLIIMAVFWVLQPIEPLTEVGMKVLGVFLAVLLDEAVRALINLWKYLRIVKAWEN